MSSVIAVRGGGISRAIATRPVRQRAVIAAGLRGRPGLPEAPIDDQQYARQNGAWVVVVGGGGSGVSSFNTRTGAITLNGTDVTTALGFTPVNPSALAPVATSGSYADLANKPFIPTTYGDVGGASAAQGALADTAVQPAALASGLADKVDKVTGKQLSDENYTAAEKAKLAGLEPNKFQGMYASLAALQAAHPTAPDGAYAYVDAGAGSDTLLALWDSNDTEWQLQKGSGGSDDPATIKIKYESNPDTNAFTDAEKAKLGGVAAGATKVDDTDDVPEGSNLYHTAARVLNVTLAALSLATGTAVVDTDTVLVAFGKLQRQLNDHFGAGGSVHAAVTTTVNGFMSAADKVKLNAIATGATANQTDSYLLARANHTGTQTASTISDLTEVTQDIVGAMVVAGTNVSVVYDDTANTLTISATGGVGTATQAIPIACSDETTALTAGAGKVTFRMPFAFTLSAVRASLTTAQTSGSILTVDINEGGVSILSTKLTIDNTEKSSTTAATAAVISDAALADDAEITIDLDQVGDGTAKGLKVYLIGTP